MFTVIGASGESRNCRRNIKIWQDFTNEFLFEFAQKAFDLLNSGFFFKSVLKHLIRIALRRGRGWLTLWVRIKQSQSVSQIRFIRLNEYYSEFEGFSPQRDWGRRGFQGIHITFLHLFCGINPFLLWNPPLSFREAFLIKGPLFHNIIGNRVMDRFYWIQRIKIRECPARFLWIRCLILTISVRTEYFICKGQWINLRISR